MMTVHGDGLRRRQECYDFDVSWEPHDGAMDSSDASMSTSLVWTKLQHILSMAGQQIPQESAKTRWTPDTVQNIPDSPDPLNDVSFTSMTVHGDGLRRRQECYEFRRFLEPADGAMDSSDASNVYITGLDEATEYTFYGWAKNSAGIRKLGGRQCDHRTEYTRFSISLNDVSLLP
jgi:hypothetical protein